LFHRSGQTKVGYFEQTIAVYQQIAGLQISMDNTHRMQILKSQFHFKYLNNLSLKNKPLVLAGFDTGNIDYVAH
jgi:hypothetical protein